MSSDAYKLQLLADNREKYSGAHQVFEEMGTFPPPQPKIPLKNSWRKWNKQFKCDICNVYFGHKGNLKHHVATVHEGKKQFKCDICNVEFGQKVHLKKHVARAHQG